MACFSAVPAGLAHPFLNANQGLKPLAIVGPSLRDAAEVFVDQCFIYYSILTKTVSEGRRPVMLQPRVKPWVNGRNRTSPEGAQQ